MSVSLSDIVDIETRILMFSAALAVLKCPMSVEDKIQTLTTAIEEQRSSLGYSPVLPTTGLLPFDNAVINLDI